MENHQESVINARNGTRADVRNERRLDEGHAGLFLF